jgi:hypothetical protein
MEKINSLERFVGAAGLTAAQRLFSFHCFQQEACMGWEVLENGKIFHKIPAKLKNRMFRDLFISILMNSKSTSGFT